MEDVPAVMARADPCQAERVRFGLRQVAVFFVAHLWLSVRGMSAFWPCDGGWPRCATTGGLQAVFRRASQLQSSSGLCTLLGASCAECSGRRPLKSQSQGEVQLRSRSVRRLSGRRSPPHREPHLPERAQGRPRPSWWPRASCMREVEKSSLASVGPEACSLQL